MSLASSSRTVRKLPTGRPSAGGRGGEGPGRGSTPLPPGDQCGYARTAPPSTTPSPSLSMAFADQPSVGLNGSGVGPVQARRVPVIVATPEPFRSCQCRYRRIAGPVKWGQIRLSHPVQATGSTWHPQLPRRIAHLLRGPRRSDRPQRRGSGGNQRRTRRAAASRRRGQTDALILLAAAAGDPSAQTTSETVAVCSSHDRPHHALSRLAPLSAARRPARRSGAP